MGTLFNLKNPFSSVAVPMVVLLINTLANGRGLRVLASRTCPLIFEVCATNIMDTAEKIRLKINLT